MRIVHTINSLAMGGAETLVLLELAELKRRGHEVSVITLESGDFTMTGRFRHAELTRYQLTKPRYFSIREYLDLINAIDPDILHTHLFPAFLYGNIARAKSRKLKFIHTEHNTSNNRRKPYLWPLDIGMYVLPDKLICISEGVLKATKLWNPFLRLKQAVVIENAVNPSRRKVNYQRSAGRLRLVSVGRLVTDKNFDLQLRLVHESKNIELDIFGDGPLGGHLTRLAAALKISDRVRLRGIHHNLGEIYYKYDGYLHTATLEGFGLVVAEAMSAGLPTFVPNIPGVSEVVGDFGFVYSSGNLGSLKTVIEDAYTKTPEEMAEVGVRAIRASSRFSIESHVDKLERVYSSVL